MAAKKTAKQAPESETAPKPIAKKAAKKTVAKKVPVAKKVAAKPSLDTIARAAYLNYRRRVEQGLPGDSHDDWLEAERQTSQLA